MHPRVNGTHGGRIGEDGDESGTLFKGSEINMTEKGGGKTRGLKFERWQPLTRALCGH